MPADLLPLRDIKSHVNAGRLVLNEETLGQECFKTLRKFFRRQPIEFELTLCKTIEDGGDAFVTFDGTFSRLNTWKNVGAKFTLFDAPTSVGRTQRHGVFAFAIPPSYSAYRYLSQYCLEETDAADDNLILFNPDITGVLDSVEFFGSADQPLELIFSSVDYSSAAPGINIYYPKRLEALLPARDVGQGINFLAAVKLDQVIAETLAELFKGSPDKSGADRGLISSEEDESYFRIRKTLKAKQAVGPVSLELEEIAFILPLSGNAGRGIQVLLDGVVGLGDRSFRTSAEFDSYYRELALSIRDFPSLSELMKLAGLSGLDEFFPEPLSSLLDVQLSDLGLVLSLANGGSISELSAGLTTKKELELIANVISIQPSLAMRVYAPFDEELHEIEGEIRGAWQLGETKFETALSYPSYSFSARMVVGQKLDAKNLLAKVLPGIPLPELQLTNMEVYGNFLSKSFSAQIEVDGKSTWTFNLAGKQFGVNSIQVGVIYENAKLAGCNIDGKLSLAGVDVFISAQYDECWTLLGGTALGAYINLKTGLNDLLQNLSLPSDLPDLKLTNLVFFASPATGEYSIRGQTADDWKLTDKLSFKVEEFGVSCKGTDVTGVLTVVVTIDSIVLRLSARKASGSSGDGWLFEGSTGRGQHIPIGGVIQWIVSRFGEVSLPDSLKSCVIKDLSITFDTATRNFTFTCDGSIDLPDAKTTLKGTIVINVERQPDGLYKKTFGGTLIISPEGSQPLQFALKVASGAEDQTFLATYSGDQKINIDSVVEQIFREPITTGAELTLKGALFAYRGDEGGAKYLFGIKIGLDIALVELPIVGPMLPPELEFSVEDLRILAASRDFRVLDINALNALLPSEHHLPSGQTDGDKAFEKGLNVSAKLKLSGVDKLLMLPAGGTTAPPQRHASTPASAAPGSPATTTTSPTADEAKASAGISKWFDIQKNLGPLRVQRVGVQYKEQRLGLLFDGGLELLGVRLELIGLSASLPIKQPQITDLKFELEGLELSVKRKPLEISGSLLRVTNLPVGVEFQYDGRVLVKAEVFTLAAMGSYAQLYGKPSLFIFAVLHKEIGGPSFFFVTGLAFGFGVNRKLKLPDISQVHNFPLIKGATDPEYFGGSTSPRAAMEKLQEYIPPSVGDYWIAAGVKFNSFGMIDSFAMLSVSFGTDLQIAILGLSKITVPRKVEGVDIEPVACAELAIKVTFTLSTGLLAAEARLTENSFIFSKDCQLRGGFALYVWCGPENAGDFVLTLGGYHPRFVPKPHYPLVPRLGLNWRVGENLVIAGELYFALTPSCIMAGGKLAAAYQSGKLRAWFCATADFLINWQPFSYDVEMSVQIGVAYTIEFLGISKTLGIELAAWIKMWGPPFGGTAHISWSILSFDVDFGEKAVTLEKLKWKQFAKSFLPPAEADSDPAVGAIRITSGLIREQEVTRSGKKHILRAVSAHELSFTTESVIPATKVLLNGKPVVAQSSSERALGIRPMDLKSIKSVHEVTFEPKTSSLTQWDTQVDPSLSTRSVPKALWDNSGLQKVREPSAEMIENVPNGVHVSLKSRQPSHELAPIELEKFKFAPIFREIHLIRWTEPGLIDAPGKKTLANTIWGNDSVRNSRESILTALGKDSAKVQLKNLAKNSGQIFQAEPDMAQLGEPLKRA